MEGHQMSDPITVVVSGEPVAKGRPRMTRRGITYTPAQTRKYEAHGRLAAQQAMNGRPPVTGPVRCEIWVDLPVPASWSLKRQAATLAGYIRPTSRPDTNNYVKAQLDVNGIAITDDSRRTRRGEEIRAHPDAHDHVHAGVGDSKWGAAA
jgi:Holliday junction resolvase RusA-like endonuclease